MWTHPLFTQRLGLSHPIVQAPMAPITLADLVATSSEAGALGSLSSAMLSVAEVQAEVSAIRARTNRAFALNFFVHAPPQLDRERVAALARRLNVPEPSDFRVPGPFDAAMLECVLALKPAAVSFHFGVPDPAALAALKRAGIVVMSSATCVHEGRLLEQAGVDAIIAQGSEAGGHRGTFAVPFEQGEVGLMSLLPQLVDAVSLPVIAAGGIADGRGIAAARMLGAAAVQLGTAFLGTPEAKVSPIHRRTLSEPRAANTRITRVFTGRPARAIVTRQLDELADLEDKTLEFPLQRVLTAALARGSDDPDRQTMWSGQNAAGIRPMPAAQLIATLVAETDAALRSAS